MRQKLEQVLLYLPRDQKRERAYGVIDLESLSAIALYTGPLSGKPLGGSGPLGGFKRGSFGNLFTDYDLGELTGDKSLSGWKLQERFDFKDLEKPHINYGITGPKGGYFKNLGDAHKIDLDF